MANKSDLANVYLDIVEGSYSSIDVDNVDNEKYPLLKNVQFYNVSMEAGICILHFLITFFPQKNWWI